MFGLHRRRDGVDGRLDVARVDTLGTEFERKRFLHQRLHAHLLGRFQRLSYQVQRLLPVARLVAADEHVGVLVLGVGDPGPGPHPSVNLQCVLKMSCCYFPTAHRGGQQTEITRGRTVANSCNAVYDVALTVRQKLRVEYVGAAGIAESAADFRQKGHVGEPTRAPVHVSEVVRRQLVKLVPRFRLTTQLAV